MKTELIIPIDALHGKLNGKDNYYFRLLNGQVIVQHCPRRRKKATPAQKQARQLFTKRAAFVAQNLTIHPQLSRHQLWILAASVIV